MSDIGCYSDIDHDDFCPDVLSERIDRCSTLEEIVAHLCGHGCRIGADPLAGDTVIPCHDDNRFVLYPRYRVPGDTCNLYGYVFEPPEAAGWFCQLLLAHSRQLHGTRIEGRDACHSLKDLLHVVVLFLLYAVREGVFPCEREPQSVLRANNYLTADSDTGRG